MQEEVVGIVIFSVIKLRLNHHLQLNFILLVADFSLARLSATVVEGEE